MAVKPCALQIDARRREMDNRGTPMFPCGGYVTMVGDHVTGQIPWHWHEEVEVLLIVSGILKLDAPNHAVTLREGDAAFINSSVLHSAVNIDNSVCEVASLVFAPKLIFGSFESAIEQKYVRPLVNCPRLGVIHFKKEVQWQDEALKCIEEAYSCYKYESFGYELIVRNCLSRLWLLLASNHQHELAQHKDSKNTETVRVKAMLGYIHDSYAESISLKNIADSAAISGREALRCFTKVLHTTPMKYLLAHRVSVAAGLLEASDLNITEVGRQSGFESPSYFSLKFRMLTDLTPKEYRRLNRFG